MRTKFFYKLFILYINNKNLLLKLQKILQPDQSRGVSNSCSFFFLEIVSDVVYLNYGIMMQKPPIKE